MEAQFDGMILIHASGKDSSSYAGGEWITSLLRIVWWEKRVELLWRILKWIMTSVEVVRSTLFFFPFIGRGMEGSSDQFP